jgi:flagellar motility protein MotE (MotC chaperone)
MPAKFHLLTPPRRIGRKPLAAATLAALLAAAGPAATETAPTVVAAAETESEIQRFCSSIADAARDRRYALQRMEMETLQREVDKRIALLEEKRAEYESWMKRRETFLAQAEGNVVEIYASMKPDAAAERLAMLDVELAAGILMKLESRRAGVILNEMESKAAAALTGIMASAARREDPT